DAHEPHSASGSLGKERLQTALTERFAPIVVSLRIPNASPAGLTRGSIFFANFFAKMMDCRVKPGNDDCGCRQREPGFARRGAPGGGGFAGRGGGGGRAFPPGLAPPRGPRGRGGGGRPPPPPPGARATTAPPGAPPAPPRWWDGGRGRTAPARGSQAWAPLAPRSRWAPRSPTAR